MQLRLQHNLFRISLPATITSNATSSLITDVKVTLKDPQHAYPFDFTYKTGSTQWSNWYDTTLSSSIKFDKISYKRVLSDNLKVMDSSAISLARDNLIPMVVFSILKNNSFEKVSKGEGKFTIISEE